jgi:hypothetical protein
MRDINMTLKNPKRRMGLTSVEVVVAAGLLASIIGIFSALSARTNQVLKSAKQYQIAAQELANQLELLTSIDDVARQSALSALSVPDAIAKVLPEATMGGREIVDETGTRLLLWIDWNRGVQSKPVELIAWLDTMPAQSNGLLSSGSASAIELKLALDSEGQR